MDPGKYILKKLQHIELTMGIVRVYKRQKKSIYKL